MHVGPVVLWDFDGTLAHRPGMWRAALATALRQVDPKIAVAEDALRSGLQDGFPWHQPQAPHPELSTSERWWDALAPVLVRAYEQAGVRREIAMAAAPLVRTAFLDPATWVVFDDTRPALELMRAHGWRGVVVSNHVPELPALVDRLGLGNLLEDVVTSAACGYEKPHPQILRIALERSGHPHRAWVVGDSEPADIAGAASVGLPSVLVRRHDGEGLLRAVDRILAGGR